MWISRVMFVGDICGFSCYFLRGDKFGVVGYCVWGDRCGVVCYCVRGEICGVVGNYVWRGGLALCGFLCVDSGGLFQVIVFWDNFVQLKDNMLCSGSLSPRHGASSGCG